MDNLSELEFLELEEFIELPISLHKFWAFVKFLKFEFRRFFALGIATDTGLAPNACRRMSGKPGPQGTPLFKLQLLVAVPVCYLSELEFLEFEEFIELSTCL